MNELMITFMGGGWIYFKTDQEKADKAFDEFLRICEDSGMNMDNMDFAKCELRSEEKGMIDVFIPSYPAIR